MRWLRWVLCLLVVRLASPWWVGREASGWYEGEARVERALADELVAFELGDDATRAKAENQFAGEWALVTHQMIALGLAQVCLQHPEYKDQYAKVVTKAALKSWAPEMRDFGTRAWRGEDALASLDGPHGHAYFAYPALAVGMARLLDPEFPPAIAVRHDALVAAYERRMLASPTGLIETYPNQAFPTDVAAVAAAIAVHGRATGVDHARVLQHWAARVRELQIDKKSGFVWQRMGAWRGEPKDAPRGSGTGLAAYFAGFADRALAEELGTALFAHESSFFGFSAIREYAEGFKGRGDNDSGPVILGVSVAATGFTLAPARAFGRREVFERVFRTTALFGVPVGHGDRVRFATGGPIGNALLLAMLTSGPELAK